MERFENFKTQIIIILLVEIAALFVLSFVGLEEIVLYVGVAVIINVILIIWILRRVSKDREQVDVDITRVLGNDTKEALIYGKVGMIIFDDQYQGVWCNNFLEERNVKIIGKKVASWIEAINEIFSGEVDEVIGEDQGYIYKITKKERAKVLYVKDVTEVETLKAKYEKNKMVAGLVQLDNYMEIQSYDDENKIALVNTQIRQKVVEWAKKYKILIRRLRSDRFLIILNEEILNELVANKFEILNEVRHAAEEIDETITLSMAFGRGTEDLAIMDGMLNDLLELAQSRGGDQVAIKKYGESVIYYGGNSEAQEKRSKVRVRVMAQAIKEGILSAEQVFIIGHDEMDMDCMGAALGMSRVTQANGRKCYILAKDIRMEEHLRQALLRFDEALSSRHQIISEEEALKLAKDKDLIIVVDHNNPNQSATPKILEKISKKIIIDHHRRSEAFIENPLLTYIETSASSTCELVSELVPYQVNRVDISEEEATIMYDGILVDTNRFKMRTGSRTFQAVAFLKQVGVDAQAAEDILRDSYSEFEEKTAILKEAKRYEEVIMIAPVEQKQVSRSLMSQCADSLLNIKNIEASFVIAEVRDHEVAVSARSKGVMNVQKIMESMQGGGHFSAAALQRKDTTVQAIYEELLKAIELYQKEGGETHESNLVK